MAGKRLLYFDVVKFLAIYTVCLNHSFGLIDNGGKTNLALLVITFNMPLFMLLGGYFSASSLKISPLSFLKKKSIQLLIPALSFSLLTCLVIFLLGADNPKLECRNEMIGGMYFLRVLWACYVIMYFSIKFCKNEWLAILSSCVLLFIIPRGSFLRINFFLLFFWTGYLMRKYQTFFSDNRLIVTFFSLFFFILLPKGEPQVVDIKIIFERPLILPQYYLAGLFGSIVVINAIYYLCRFFPKSFLLQYAGKIGMFTLGIYGLQSVIINRISYHFIHFNTPERISEYIIVPLVSLLYVFICYYLVIYLKRVKILNYLLFGNQY